MKLALRLLCALAATAFLAGCATSADETWINPATGRVQSVDPPSTN